MLLISRISGSVAAAALVLAPIAATAKTPDDLDDLVGARGSSGETAMQDRGYHMHHSSPSDDGRYSYWWNSSKKQCVRVLTSDGRYSAIKSVGGSDCGHNDGSDAAAVAIGAAALIGIAALASKSHHRDDKDYDERGTADFERGYRDGLYNQSYHNYSRSEAYGHGYSSGVEERGYKTSYRSGYNSRGGYDSYSGYSDLVGRSNSHVDDTLRDRGYRYMGTEDLSSGHERTYWNSNTRQCISVRTRSGDVEDIHSVPSRVCR